MKPTLVVFPRTDAFGEVWSRLATACGAELAMPPAAVEAAVLRGACGVVIGVGGAEELAGAAVEELGAFTDLDIAVVGAATDHRFVASLLGSGITGYFALPGDLGALQDWVAERVARRTSAARAQVLSELRREQYDFRRIVGRSPALLAALERAARVIPHGNTTVLVTGETGTGKELLAEAIHYNGPRAAKPFLELNCAALPATLLEAELFGYEKGAFTDARIAKPGLLEVAHGGTVFLDEIGDLSLDLQAKLLKVLEDRRVRRLGSLRDAHIDVRIVAATHADLPTAVAEGCFRQDLYYRLAVVPVHLPALREREGDVIRLAEHFLRRFSADYGVECPRLGPKVRSALLAHRWPGNIRELRNAIERAVLLGGGSLRPEDLFLESGPRASLGAWALPFPADMETLQRFSARRMVEHFGGNKRAAAKALRISPARLYRLLDPAGEADESNGQQTGAAAREKRVP